MKNFILRSNIVFVLLLIGLCMSSCSNTGNETFNKQTLNINSASVDTQTTEDFSSIETIYQLNKPLISNEDQTVSCERVMIPPEINGLRTSVIGVYNKDSLFLLLYEEIDSPILKAEFGLFDLNSQKYETLLPVRPNVSRAFRCNNDRYMIYISSEYLSSDYTSQVDELRALEIDTKKDFLIHRYPDGYMSSSAKNSITLFNEKVYFDEIVYENDEIKDIDTYEYDLQTNTLKKFRGSAQNPIVYKESIFTIVKNNADNAFQLESFEQDETIKLSRGINGVFSNNKTLFSIENKFTDHKEKTTLSNLNNITANEELLTTTTAIDQIQGNDKFITWRNFTMEKPILYLIDEDQFLMLNDLPPSYNTYIIGDEISVLICTNDNDIYTSEYYILKQRSRNLFIQLQNIYSVKDGRRSIFFQNK